MADDLPPGAVGQPIALSPSPAASLPPGAAGPVIDLKPSSISDAPVPGGGDSELGMMGGGISGKEFVKGLAAGVGEVGSGIAETLPTLPGFPDSHGPAARTSQFLKSVPQGMEGKAGEWAGYLAPFLGGGDALGGAKLASKIPELGEGVLSRFGTQAARGATEGAVAGGEAGAASPTGKEDYSEALAEKGRETARGAALGAAGGAGFKAAGPLLKGAKSGLDTLTGSKATSAAERLREELSGRATGVTSAEAAKSEEALKRAGQIDTRLQQETEHLDASKGAVGDAEAAAGQLDQELRANPTMDTKTFGDRVRKLAADTHDKYRKIREQQSGYSAAIAESPEGPVVNTKPIRELLNEWKKETASGSEKSIISYLEDEIATKEGTGEKAVNGINVKRADSLRKVLDELYRTKDMKVIGKGDGSAASANRQIARVHALLKKALTEADPRLAEATRKFRELSQPLDFLERKGPLAGALRKDTMGREYTMERGRLVENLLSKTKAGSNAFARLIKEDPELKDDARQFFQHRLYGEQDFEKPVTPEAMQKFLRDNHDALEQTGLLDEFSKKANRTAQAAETVDKMSAQAKIRQGNVAALESTLKDAQKDHKLSSELRDNYDTMLARLKVTDGDPKETVDAVEKVASKLRSDGFLSAGDYEKYLKDLKDAHQSISDTKALRKRITQIGIGLTFAIAGYKYGHLGIDFFR